MLTSRVFCPKKAQHEQLAHSCFRLMSRRLRRDICKLDHPGAERKVMNKWRPSKLSLYLLVTPTTTEFTMSTKLTSFLRRQEH